MDFNSILKENISIVDNALARYLKHEENAQNIIYESMGYSLFAGGKRLRPIIMILANEMCGGDVEDVLPFACAMEMIHTYSLIHDDLPAMDNDDMRRGKPTNHITFGEDIAILAGDALLNKAMETALSAEIPADRIIRACKVLFKSTGTEGMIGGQVIDIKNAKLTKEELENLHLLKTGAIIRSSAVIGGIVAGASEEEIAALDEFCKNLGIAFQIQDDVLDVKGDAEALGKPVGSDEDNDKTTYVTLYGVERSEELSREYTQKAIDSIKGVFGDKSEKLVSLAEFLCKRKI